MEKGEQEHRVVPFPSSRRGSVSRPATLGEEIRRLNLALGRGYQASQQAKRRGLLPVFDPGERGLRRAGTAGKLVERYSGSLPVCAEGVVHVGKCCTTRNRNQAPMFRPDVTTGGVVVPYRPNMPKRTAKPRRQYSPTYMRAWRESAGLSMDALLNRIAEAGVSDLEGLSKSSLSRIETGKQPYNQAILEAIAHALDCALRPIYWRPTRTHRLGRSTKRSARCRPMRLSSSPPSQRPSRSTTPDQASA